MNAEKTGKFIKLLREEKKLTQQNLAEKIHIGRQAISKWELGRTMPDHSSLLKLSEIFKVSIDELLAGEKNTKNNIALVLYKENRKNAKRIKIIIMFIIILCILFLGYYYFNQYNSTKVYTIYGGNDNITIENGLFIVTPEKIYFNIGTIKSEEIIEKVVLVQKLDGAEKTIYSSDSMKILLKDYVGYEEYFEFKKIKSLINHLYVKIFINNKEYKIKLIFDEDYKNDNIFFFSKKKIDERKTIEVDNLISNSLINIIKNKFQYKNNIYTNTLKYNNYVENYNYYEDINLLNIEILENNIIIEDWNYNIALNYFTYINYKENFSFNYKIDNKETKCLYGHCENYIKIYNVLKNKIEKIR